MFRFLPLPSKRSGRRTRVLSASKSVGLLLALAILAALPAGAQIYVAPPPVGSDLTGDGSAGSPYATIQHAFDMAADGDTILVGEGTYNECLFLSGVYDETPNQRSIHVLAEAFDAGDPSTRELTVIDGTGACPAGYSTINIGGFDSSIEGFTVTGGEYSGIWSIAGVTITNNVIEGNASNSGGGLYVYPDNCFYGEVQVNITNNLIRNNTVSFDGSGALSGLGGGMLVGLYPEAYVAGDPLAQPDACRGGGGGMLIQGNTIETNDTEYDGGGIYALTYSYPDLAAAQITITQNTISQNTGGSAGAIAYGGGVLATTFGYGTETIEILGNDVLGNTVTGYGGGIWAGTYAAYVADHVVVVDGNTISGNTAGTGGGIEASHRVVDMDPGQTVNLTVTDNMITGNTAATADELGGGGGLSAGMFSQRTTFSNTDFVISGNTIRSNTADFDGGGVELRVTAEAEDFVDPVDGDIRPAHAAVDFSNNLVVLNQVSNSFGDGVGGGALAFLQAFGGEQFNPDEPSRATLNMELNTFADNIADLGAGGLEIEVYTGVATGTADGVATLNFESGIVSNNQIYGLGGPQPGVDEGVFTPGNDGINTAELTVNVSYSDVFGNDTDYEIWIGDRTGQEGNISLDPLLDEVTFVPASCSPTLDTADPLVDYSLEPAPSGGRANMGHTGGTAAATTSLADASGDAEVDGIDVLRIAVAFGSTFGQNRWDAAADMDGSGIVDGDDLALVAAGFGQTCP
jgi:hypothetical protein